MNQETTFVVVVKSEAIGAGLADRIEAQHSEELLRVLSLGFGDGTVVYRGVHRLALDAAGGKQQPVSVVMDPRGLELAQRVLAEAQHDLGTSDQQLQFSFS